MLKPKVSAKAVAIGSTTSLAAYVAMSAVLDRALDAASSETTALATYGFLHCALMLVAIPTALGVMTGRFAGHDRACNGALAALPVSLYALASLASGDCACCGLVGALPAALFIPFCTAVGAKLSGAPAVAAGATA